jgi:hypothetical protein
MIRRNEGESTAPDDLEGQAALAQHDCRLG